MLRRLNMTLRRATSVGCAVNTGVMHTASSSFITARARNPRIRALAVAVSRAGFRAAVLPFASSIAERRRRLRWLVSARLISSKVKGEGTRQKVGRLGIGGNIDCVRASACCELLAGDIGILPGGLGLTPGNRRAPQRLDRLEQRATQRVAALLAQYPAQQRPQGANVAPQGRFLPLTGAGLEFG